MGVLFQGSLLIFLSVPRLKKNFFRRPSFCFCFRPIICWQATAVLPSTSAYVSCTRCLLQISQRDQPTNCNTNQPIPNHSDTLGTPSPIPPPNHHQSYYCHSCRPWKSILHEMGSRRTDHGHQHLSILHLDPGSFADIGQVRTHLKHIIASNFSGD